MKKYLFLFGVLISFHARSSAAGVLYDNGAPDLRSGYEITHWIEADQFSFTAASVIQSITFWESEAGSDFQGSIVWEIFSDSANNPATLVASGTSTSLTHSATGRLVLGAYPEYIDSFSITPVSLQPGTYWLALHNGPLSYNVNKNTFWETTTNSNPVPSQQLVEPFTGSFTSNSAGAKLAFQLLGVPPPRITSIAYNHGSPTFTFTAVSGQTYRAEYKNNLTDPAWTTVRGAAVIYGFNGTIQVTDSDPNARTAPARFYHIVLL